MTSDETAVVLATRCPFKSKESWSDFFDMSPDLQRIEATLIRDAVFERDDGPGLWQWLIAFMNAAGTVAGAVSGVSSAYVALKSLA